MLRSRGFRTALVPLKFVLRPFAAQILEFEMLRTNVALKCRTTEMLRAIVVWVFKYMLLCMCSKSVVSKAGSGRQTPPI